MAASLSSSTVAAASLPPAAVAAPASTAAALSTAAIAAAISTAAIVVPNPSIERSHPDFPMDIGVDGRLGKRKNLTKVVMRPMNRAAREYSDLFDVATGERPAPKSIKKMSLSAKALICVFVLGIIATLTAIYLGHGNPIQGFNQMGAKIAEGFQIAVKHIGEHVEEYVGAGATTVVVLALGILKYKNYSKKQKEKLEERKAAVCEARESISKIVLEAMNLEKDSTLETRIPEGAPRSFDEEYAKKMEQAGIAVLI